MACACGKNKAKFEVVTDGGKVVFTASVRSTAETVAKRYPGSAVRQQGGATADATTKPTLAKPQA